MQLNYPSNFKKGGQSSSRSTKAPRMACLNGRVADNYHLEITLYSNKEFMIWLHAKQYAMKMRWFFNGYGIRDMGFLCTQVAWESHYNQALKVFNENLQHHH